MRRSLALSLLLSSAACAPAGAGGGDGTDGLHLVPDGKADNYYSNVAAEFVVSGRIPVELTAEEAADEQLRQAKVTGRLTAVGLYLTTYMTDKFRGIDSNNDGTISDDEVFFHNEGYGGFHAMVRNYSIEAGDVSEEGGTFFVELTMDIGGPQNFLSIVPQAEGAESAPGTRVFDLQMPKGAAIDPTNVPRRDARRFDPRSYDGELETLRLTARQLPTPGNAWPHFADFVADGLYDITLFYGHDYNESRSDLREARDAFEELQRQGFTLPAASFDDLKRDSGAFVKEVRANGREVRLEVRVFHSEMFTDARREQHDLAISELAARDVFFYNGHAGPYYGFYLDAADAAKVGYQEIADAPFTDRQQLFVAQGCQTYSQYADMVYASPAKSEANLDAITTVNYSYGQGTIELLRNLIRTDGDGNHEPTDFYRIVAQLNEDWLNSARHVFYGVMGIDGNPQLHPYADVAAIGDACSANADCGDASGNVCVSGECAARSLAEAACPAGTTYSLLGDGPAIVGGVCTGRATDPTEPTDPTHPTDPIEPTDPTTPAGAGTCESPIDVASAAERAPDGALLYRGSNAGATDGQAASCLTGMGGREVVLAFTPETSGTLHASTESTGTTFDTVLSVRGSACNESSELACDDDSGENRTSTLSAPVTAGETVYLLVDAYTASATGDFELSLRVD